MSLTSCPRQQHASRIGSLIIESPLFFPPVLISQSPGKKAKRFKFLADNNESGEKEEGGERELKFVAKRI